MGVTTHTDIHFDLVRATISNLHLSEQKISRQPNYSNLNGSNILREAMIRTPPTWSTVFASSYWFCWTIAQYVFCGNNILSKQTVPETRSKYRICCGTTWLYWIQIQIPGDMKLWDCRLKRDSTVVMRHKVGDLLCVYWCLPWPSYSSRFNYCSDIQCRKWLKWNHIVAHSNTSVQHCWESSNTFRPNLTHSYMFATLNLGQKMSTRIHQLTESSKILIVHPG